MKRIISVLKWLCPKAVAAEFDKQVSEELDELLKEEMALVKAGATVAILWQNKSEGKWFDTHFCEAMNELATTSDAYLNRNLNQKK